NHSANRGGGIGWWSWGGSINIINCTVVDNIGIGGINIGGGGDVTGTITNSIIWGNRGEWSSIQIDLFDMTPEVTFCDVEGGWPGQGNIDADPLFVDSDGLDNIAGTADDNLRLLGGSPCLDAGNNLAVPPSLTTDLDGNPRIINGTVDMGAYEGPKQGLVVIPRSVTVPEGGTNTFTVALGLDPAGTIQVGVAVESGDPDITVRSGATLVFDSSNYSQPQTVTLAAAEDEDYLNGAALVSVSAPAFSIVAVNVTESENDHILYVDADAPGSNSGWDWANAFKNLQDALVAAAVNPHITEIRVAEGTYKPDQGAGQTPGNREAAFGLVNGVAIKGGYAGFGEPNPDARDIAKYETILSGDLNGDDVALTDPCDLLDEPSRAENSYHVVASFDLPDYPEVNIILDGFTISSGNANGKSDWPEEWSCGGGLYLYNPCCRGPTISNCKFSSNSGVWAGGIWGCGGLIVNCLITGNAASMGGGLSNCSGPIKNSTISNNFARDAGGGVSTYLDDHFENCTIIDNVAGVYGGGIYTENCSPILYNCTVRGNSAVLGGGMHNRAYDDYSNPVLIGCQFISNLAEGDGGAINNDYPSYYGFLTMTNCIFSRNLAAGIGGGIGNYAETNLILTNCTFAANLATNGNALSCKSQYPEYPYPSDLRLTNCILWDGGNEIWNNDNSTITITYSDVYDGWLGAENINVDPCFADAAKGDYHLKSQAGRWDANIASWVKDDVTSLCIDAGNPASPIGLEPFPNGGIINMGAYGGTHEASKSYFGEPVCETIVAGDINGDCKVNFFDLALMVLHWL
ncbi:MAG: right-handed parallel beta-helix repeat-containing protein, partial [Sedimentisphaerales bacterium]|nr:right-handed parallel beta-helix repeat-containing protein [Sedimentisphaerales bacterium]